MAVLTDYVHSAMKQAVFEELAEHSYGGRIPSCVGVIAFGSTLPECRENLSSTLEEWILLGLKLGHPLPVIANIDLNKEPHREPVDAL